MALTADQKRERRAAASQQQRDDEAARKRKYRQGNPQQEQSMPGKKGEKRFVQLPMPAMTKQMPLSTPLLFVRASIANA
jgi:hypothetical protein